MKLSLMLMLLRAGSGYRSAVTRAGASDLHGLAAIAALVRVGLAAAAAVPQMASGKRNQGKLGMASSEIVAIAGSDAPAASAGSAALRAAAARLAAPPVAVSDAAPPKRKRMRKKAGLQVMAASSMCARSANLHEQLYKPRCSCRAPFARCV
jgi:hypothetical protein